MSDATAPNLPPDDLKRYLATIPTADSADRPHLGIVGDTYTTLLTGEDTAQRFRLIDMHIPPGGGPGPHRHDFEETFHILEGELAVTFRGEKRTVHAGETINIPANAPHGLHNASDAPVRTLCICSPAGNERFLAEIGVLVPTRTSPPPCPSREQLKAFQQKASELAPKYHTVILQDA